MRRKDSVTDARKTARCALFFIAVAIFSVGSFNQKVEAGSADTLSGYAWSDTIGWISFNCTNTSSCATVDYGVNIDTNGKFSGYAWSDTIGWISFNPSDVTGCPLSGSCKAVLDTTTGAVSGWARALSADNKGWDGWIQLSGVSFSDTSASGYSWGSDVVGWVSWDGVIRILACVNEASNPPTCNACTLPLIWDVSRCVACNGGCSATPPPTCNNGANNPPACNTFTPAVSLSAVPDIIDQGESTTLRWSSRHATSCTAPGSFSGSATQGGATSGSASTGVLSSTQNYQTSCTGAGGTTASNIITVTVRIPTVSLRATPDRVVTNPRIGSGGDVTILCDATNINSCVIKKNNVVWQTLIADDSRTVSCAALPKEVITNQTVYTITCSNNAGPAAAVSALKVVNVTTSFSEF